jgi:hypothetical protein
MRTKETCESKTYFTQLAFRIQKQSDRIRKHGLNCL